MGKNNQPSRFLKRKYGYGIVDGDGKPWWDEGCVAHEPECLRETCENLNDPLLKGLLDNTPYRVVRLFWISTKGKRPKI